MKLFSKYNRIHVTSTVIIFLLGSIAFSFLLRYIIISQIDEDLKIEKHEVLTYIKRFNRMPAIIEVPDQYTTYKTIEAPAQSIDKIFTAELNNPQENKNELRRIIQFTIRANGVWYLVNVSKSLEGTDELIKNIIIITMTVIIMMLVANFFINRIVLKKLWRPFYSTLQTMQQFNLHNTQTIHFSNTDVSEFKYLNSILTMALGKAQQDYQILKEFTENTSHELQTPLAIIKSKLDNLIQDENLSESQSNSAASAYEALNRLNKINQSLLLLAKIENKQFETMRIDLKEKTVSRLNQFSELAQSKNITIQSNLEVSYINMNADLADTLLNNLLSNAIRHNNISGVINVKLDKRELGISNTGLPKSLNAERIFTRFNKSSHNDGYGLGLSIVKQICNISGCNITYQFKTPAMHNFIVSWNNL